jgi:glycosyltransferase involved in cell wall biosynthesis
VEGEGRNFGGHPGNLGLIDASTSSGSALSGADGWWMENAPRVSVIIPCRNEERFIRGSLASVLDGTFPAEEMEVLVVDGRSTDRGREIISEIAKRDPRVRLLDNPRKITPAALNIGIRAARGAIIVRVDAHAIYPPDYITTLLKTLDETGADMVGGYAESQATESSAVSRAIALATNHAFATGSPFRYRRRSGPCDALPYGCWRREIFERVGLFDERLLRNQDNEHSSRILHRGGRIYMTANARVGYFIRSTLATLWRQGAVTGMWNAFTQRLHPYTFRWRHFLPGIFFVGVLLSLALLTMGVSAQVPILTLLGAAPLSAYALIDLGVSIWLGLSQRQARLIPLLAFVFFSYHFVYGYGVARGWSLVVSGGWRKHLGDRSAKDKIA